MDTTENRYSPRPAFSIEIEGNQLTALDNRLISLSLTDNRGFEADTLDLTLDDADGQVALPPRGAKISVALGWDNDPLVFKGVYTVDEIGHAGPILPWGRWSPALPAATICVRVSAKNWRRLR
ncbi:hypothetical protein M8T01_07010 [Enterobacter sichuanensis]|nr:hypothetical protein [Enterobacter sichuanensis]